ncbi:MAG: hypothetical protein P8K76_12865 [Candidatus Binatia bacterium]|nr:hypothetical protein [Candidatus Binatia bacterium]
MSHPQTQLWASLEGGGSHALDPNETVLVWSPPLDSTTDRLSRKSARDLEAGDRILLDGNRNVQESDLPDVQSDLLRGGRKAENWTPTQPNKALRLSFAETSPEFLQGALARFGVTSDPELIADWSQEWDWETKDSLSVQGNTFIEPSTGPRFSKSLHAIATTLDSEVLRKACYFRRIACAIAHYRATRHGKPESDLQREEERWRGIEVDYPPLFWPRITGTGASQDEADQAGRTHESEQPAEIDESRLPETGTHTDAAQTDPSAPVQERTLGSVEDNRASNGALWVHFAGEEPLRAPGWHWSWHGSAGSWGLWTKRSGDIHELTAELKDLVAPPEHRIYQAWHNAGRVRDNRQQDGCLWVYAPVKFKAPGWHWTVHNKGGGHEGLWTKREGAPEDRIKELVRHLLENYRIDNELRELINHPKPI